jgi:hypothetical protein
MSDDERVTNTTGTHETWEEINTPLVNRGVYGALSISETLLRR